MVRKKKEEDECMEEDLDIYSEDSVDEMVESDALNGVEAGFMQGYIEDSTETLEE